MQLLGNLRIHFLALVLTVVAEFIGIERLGPVVVLPLFVCFDFRVINFNSKIQNSYNKNKWKILPIILVLQ